MLQAMWLQFGIGLYVSHMVSHLILSNKYLRIASVIVFIFLVFIVIECVIIQRQHKQQIASLHALTDGYHGGFREVPFCFYKDEEFTKMNDHISRTSQPAEPIHKMTSGKRPHWIKDVRHSKNSSPQTAPECKWNKGPKRPPKRDWLVGLRPGLWTPRRIYHPLPLHDTCGRREAPRAAVNAQTEFVRVYQSTEMLVKNRYGVYRFLSEQTQLVLMEVEVYGESF